MGNENVNTSNPVAEENVATMLPIVGLNGEPVTGNGVDNDYINKIKNDIEQVEDENIVKENFDDVIVNMKTSSDVNYKIRKLVASIYTLQVKIETLALTDKEEDNKEMIQMKRDLIGEQKELSAIKKSSSPELLKAIKELEKKAQEEAEKEIKENEKKKAKEEEVTEGVSMMDVADYYVTEMNHVKGIISDEVTTNRLRLDKDKTQVKESEVVKNIQGAKETINAYNEMIKQAETLLRNAYNKYADTTLVKTGKKFSEYAKITKPENPSPIFYKLGKRYIYMAESNACITFDVNFGEEGSKLVPFANILHIMRKIAKEASTANKEKLVVVRCSTYNYLKERKRGIVVNAYLRTTLGKVEPEESENEKEVKESTDDDTVSPELKRLDEKRGRLADLERDLEEARKKEAETGERLYENKVKGLTAKIDSLKKEVEEGEKKLKKEEERIQKKKDVTESVMFEAANMEPEIRPIVEELNRKGYKVRYASPGHRKLRKKEDGEPDGVYYGKLYSDARIMFDSKYSFPQAPEYWHWRDVDGCSYLDITPKGFNPDKNDTPDESFAKWKDAYMTSLKTYVKNLKPNNSKEVTESVDEFTESVMDDIYTSMGLYDEITTESYIDLNSNNSLLMELESLLS